MRLVYAIGLGTIVAASPAAATGGLSCRPVRGAGPMIDVAAGYALVPTVIGVTLREGGKVMTAGAINSTENHALVVGQAWYDAREVRLDLFDAQQVRFEGKLRVRFGTGRRGHIAFGSFTRNGRTYQVRCTAE